MKVVLRHYAPLEMRGGAEKYCELLANHLAKRGHEVSVEVTPMWREGSVFHKVEHEAWAYIVAAGRDASPADVCYLTSPLGRLVTRVTCGRVIAGTWTAAMFKVRGSIGRLIANRALMPLASAAAFKALGPWIMARLDAVHIENPYYWPLRHPRKYYVPHSADVSLFRRTAERRRIFTVFFVGRRSWDKGFDVYQRATRGFARLDEGRQGWLTDAELVDAYSRAHVVIAPSRFDTFGATVLESLLCGTPVITSPLPEHLALDMPAMYAESARTIRLRLLEMRQVWERSEAEFESRYASGLRERVLHFDSAVQLPRFEKMLEDVVGAG